MSVTLNGVLQTISAMERYFRGGFGWGKVLLHNPINGRKCLVGAVRSVRASDGNSSWVPSEEIEAAKHYIGLAVREHGGGGGGGDWAIMSYNDRSASFHQIAAVMTRAKQLAMLDYGWQQPAPVPVRALPAPAPVPQILPPPVYPALPPPAPVAPVVIDLTPEPVAEWVPVREARQAAEQVTRELRALTTAHNVWRG